MAEWWNVFAANANREETLIRVYTYKEVRAIEDVMEHRGWTLDVMEYPSSPITVKAPPVFRVLNKNGAELRTHIRQDQVFNSVMDMEVQQRNRELRDRPDADPVNLRASRRARFHELGEADGDDNQAGEPVPKG